LLDASAIVELLIDGRHREGADRVLDGFTGSEDVVLITAAHGQVEATHALRRLVRRGHLDADAGAAAVRTLRHLDFALDATGPRLERIWSLRDTMSPYDAAYAAAAEGFALPLHSTDRRLVRACAAAGIEAIHLDDLA